MKIFYTVTSKEGDFQASPTSSLGGFRSSTPVPNDVYNSLFGDISPYTIQRGLTEYIGLILQNTFDKEVKNLFVWIPKIEPNLCKYRISIVELTPNGEMESISSMNSKPLYSEFYETSENDKFEIPGSLKPSEMVGLWIERSFDQNSEEFLMGTNCDYLYEHLNQKKQTTESCSIKVSFEYA